MNTNKCPRCGCGLQEPDISNPAIGIFYQIGGNEKCKHCGQEIEWVMQWVAHKKVEKEV